MRISVVYLSAELFGEKALETTCCGKAAAYGDLAVFRRMKPAGCGRVAEIHRVL
jgi:hypothetical protein